MYPHYRGKDAQAIERNWSSVTTLEFERKTTREELFVRNERQFALLVNVSKQIQRSLGWVTIKNQNVFYPDIQAIIDTGEVLRCELEYEAGNFIRHKHPGRNCDLIVSFIRKDYQTMIAGIPVWSFYLENNQELSWTLTEDIRKNGCVDSLSYGFQADKTLDTFAITDDEV
jgi:hypothetical protein